MAFFTISGLAIDPDGRQWVVTTFDDSGDGTIIHRYSVDGEFEGKVRLPGRVKGLAFTPSHRMLTLIGREDTDGLDVLRTYSITKSAPAPD